MPLIEARDLRMYYELRKHIFAKPLFVRAVDGVTLSVGRGETLALVGESGCGKTTLGKTLLRLLTPVGGQIKFYLREDDPVLEDPVVSTLAKPVEHDGGKLYEVDITYLKEKELKWFRRKAQIIFQDPYSSLDPMHTILYTLEEPLIVAGIKDREERFERACKVLELVKLTPPEDFINKYPHMLSGGQRQRVAIARALILEPEFIVADEPVTMLDASVRVEILMLLRRLQEELGVAYLYITHDMSTAKYFARKVAVMYAGKVVEMGDFREVVREPKHPYTQALIEAIPDPDPNNRFVMRKTVPGEPPNLVMPPPGCRFHPRCPVRMDICEKEEPPVVELEHGRKVACWLYAKR